MPRQVNVLVDITFDGCGSQQDERIVDVIVNKYKKIISTEIEEQLSNL